MKWKNKRQNQRHNEIGDFLKEHYPKWKQKQPKDLEIENDEEVCLRNGDDMNYDSVFSPQEHSDRSENCPRYQLDKEVEEN